MTEYVRIKYPNITLNLSCIRLGALDTAALVSVHMKRCKVPGEDIIKFKKEINLVQSNNTDVLQVCKRWIDIKKN